MDDPESLKRLRHLSLNDLLVLNTVGHAFADVREKRFDRFCHTIRQQLDAAIGQFRTQPRTAWKRASIAADARNPTPCTVPE